MDGMSTTKSELFQHGRAWMEISLKLVNLTWDKASLKHGNGASILKSGVDNSLAIFLFLQGR
jgi:hypothetical protein